MARSQPQPGKSSASHTIMPAPASPLKCLYATRQPPLACLSCAGNAAHALATERQYTCAGKVCRGAHPLHRGLPGRQSEGDALGARGRGRHEGLIVGSLIIWFHRAHHPPSDQLQHTSLWACAPPLYPDWCPHSVPQNPEGCTNTLKTHQRVSKGFLKGFPAPGYQAEHQQAQVQGWQEASNPLV